MLSTTRVALSNGKFYDKRIMSLEDTAKLINSHVGRALAFVGKDYEGKDIEVIPTSLIPLNAAIGCGGIPRGKIIEVHGLQSNGKTSLCLSILADFQKAGLRVAFVDAEYSFNFSHAKNLGVDTDNLILLQPDYGEEAMEAVDKMIREKQADLIIIDSVSAIVPKSVLEGEVGQEQIGAQARLITQSCKKFVGPLAKSNTTVIFINQLRVNIMGGQYDPYITPGGMALKFFTSLSLRVQKNKAIKSGDNLIGYNIHVTVKKNKVGLPGGECDLQLIFGSGFSSESAILDNAEKLGVVTKTGNTYYFGEIKLGIGQNRARTFLEENPTIAEEIKNKL